jgi:hypothetical protein
VWSVFVRGYLSIRPLSDAECEAFVLLRMARGFGHAAPALAFWETGRDDMLKEIEIAVRELDRDFADKALLRQAFENAASRSRR